MHAFSLHGLLPWVQEMPAFAELLAALRAGQMPDSPLGVPEPLRAAVAAALADQLDRPMLWVVEQPDEARAIGDALQALLTAPERVHVFPAPDALPFERIPWDPTTRELRLATLSALARWAREPRSGTAPVIVAPLRSLLLCTLSPEDFRADSRRLSPGHQVQLTELARSLERLGYQSAPTVSEPGQMARRGGIIDIFPPALGHPVRLEWFGDEVESIRAFDRNNQRSRESLAELDLGPAAEALAIHGPRAAATLADVDLRWLHPLAESAMNRQRQALDAGRTFDGIEHYGPLLHPGGATLLDHLPAQTLVLMEQGERLDTLAANLREQAQLVRRGQVEAGELPEGWPGEPLASWPRLAERIAPRQLDLGAFAGGRESAWSHSADRPQAWAGRVEDAMLDLAEQAQAGAALVIVSRQAPRLAELLLLAGLAIEPTDRLDAPPAASRIALIHGALGAGWLLRGPTGPRGVITDGEIFGWRMPHRRRQRRAADPGRRPDYFAELHPGDYVVHIEHGIGVFRGLERMAVGEVERDYLKLEYSSGDTLFVPTHQADRIARYVGAGEVEPAITRLGTADWEKAKKRARRAVEDIAREILELYARRETASRAAFASDTTWQAELEAAFPYVETDDQLKAIEAVKADMESERPMDRLVVGDVGFGKTEVALRAAFKAVMGGKQVAILAPTTVLAQQHLETFSRRMLPFPVRVEMLSRLRGPRQQSEILDRLAGREIDIIIGTHRLLSEDVRFHDLGLVIIDEEHRFGVKHKERLRQLRDGVDTLTLTATPIPRTMHMALTGLRDLTTIDTPPEERLPVITHVGPYDDAQVQQAIRRELARRGQVFYVYNRVQGIEMIAQKLSKLVPEARLSIAHGQMHQDELAESMLDFVGMRVDILVCTSIIESGLDIPNANTLIVEHAERFGLAQLHQLRGRVGRSSQRAYAYFLHPAGYELPEDARLRLETIVETGKLGSGFGIAMRDLEIRGAGEILGARQHGQVAAIGLDLYTRLLAEAIKKLRADQPGAADGAGDRVAEELAEIDPGGLPTVDLPVDAFLPEPYVPEMRERTRLYRRMATATSPEAVREIEAELRDRFGQPPWEVSCLLDVLWLRVLTHMAGARSVAKEGEWAVIRWPASHQIRRVELKYKLDPAARLGNHQVSLQLRGRPEQWLPELRRALETMVAVEGRAAAPAGP